MVACTCMPVTLSTVAVTLQPPAQAPWIGLSQMRHAHHVDANKA